MNAIDDRIHRDGARGAALDHGGIVSASDPDALAVIREPLVDGRDQVELAGGHGAWRTR